MVIRIASVVLSFAGLLALILGLLVWANSALNLIQMHMLLGFLAVGALWVIGIGQAFSRGGSWLLAACALAVGAAMIIIGLNQSALMLGPFTGLSRCFTWCSACWSSDWAISAPRAIGKVPLAPTDERSRLLHCRNGLSLLSAQADRREET